ncbi:MAG: hypothetical protein IJ555_10780 [Ruminococcus sp.]|nr:hypothetical protein [Ruminococcus sp.]
MSKMVRKGLTKRTIAGLTAFGLAVTCFGINAEMPSLFDLGSDTRVIPVSDNTVLTPENTGSAGGEEQDNGTSIDNNQKDNNLLTEDAVDYKGIIEESKDEEFRQIAEISKDTVVVAREETDASESIESEVWFGNQFADYRVLMEKDNGDSKTVYYEIETTDDV